MSAKRYVCNAVRIVKTHNLYGVGRFYENRYLGSSKMQKLLEVLSEQFDYIILDLPPVNAVSDAIAVSRWITGMLLVVRQNYTNKKDVENCVRQLTFSNVKVLGCVMNECEDGVTGKGKYKRYSQNYGYGASAEKKTTVKRPPSI